MATSAILAELEREHSQLPETTKLELLGGYRLLLDGFVTVEQELAQELSKLTETRKLELLGGYRLLLDGIATVEQACPDPDEVRDAMSKVMARVVREFTDADCVFVRQRRTDGSLEVVGTPVWREGMQVGLPPRVKLRGEGISGWVVEHSIDEPVVITDLNDPYLPQHFREAHEKTFRQHTLNDDEKAFVNFIRTEACVALRMSGRVVGAVVAIRGTPYQPEHAERVGRLLRAFNVILSSLFTVGWILHDFHRTNRRMQGLSRVLPSVAATTDDELFLRRVVTLLTSHCGLGWHRAILFAFDGEYPADARCVMAVGGWGESDWSKKHDQLSKLKTLEELLELCDRADFAHDDRLFQWFKETPRIIPKRYFETYMDFWFCPRNRRENTNADDERILFDEGVLLFTPEDTWLKRVDAISSAFEGRAAECTHFLVPFNWIASTKDGFRYRCPGFALLDNPYVQSKELVRQMPLTRMFCNVFAGLFDSRFQQDRSPPCESASDDVSERTL